MRLAECYFLKNPSLTPEKALYTDKEDKKSLAGSSIYAVSEV